jgi:hypothetical protein
MSLQLDLTAPAGPDRVDPDALIREARRRARRRRACRFVALACLIAVGAVVYAVSVGGSRVVRARTAAHPPSVNVHAFRGHGELAFISRGQLWVLAGQGGTLRHLSVPRGDAPRSPALSPDGRWLAYIVARAGDLYGPSQLWISHADGTGPHRVPNLVVTQFVGWSSRADLVAVTTGHSATAHFALPAVLDVVSPDGRIRALLRPATQPPTVHGGIWSATWSPTGASLAVSTDSAAPHAGTQIVDVPVAAGARPSVWLSIPSTERLRGGLGCGRRCGDTEAIADLAGWWPTWGIGFWVFSSGMTHNSDSTPLAVITRPGGPPRALANTPSDGVTDAVSGSSHGQLALVESADEAGRDDAAGKTVERCSPDTSNCRALPGARTWTGSPLGCQPCFGASGSGPGSAVSLDPAWSPGGTLLAYVKAPVYRGGGSPRLAWFQAHQLEVWNSRTDLTRQLGAISGASVPTWSRNGRSILYVSGNGLWLADGRTGRTVEIEHPLYRESAWRKVGSTDLSFYGQIPWTQQFSWFSR